VKIRPIVLGLAFLYVAPSMAQQGLFIGIVETVINNNPVDKFEACLANSNVQYCSRAFGIEVPTAQKAPTPTESAATPPTKVKEKKPSRWARFADISGQIAWSAYLAHYCPQVRAIPLVFFTARDYQFLQTCVAYGY
jgi:hypothetical protein